MGSPSDSTCLSLPPFLRHICCFPPPPPSWSLPTCDIRSLPETLRRHSIECHGRLDGRQILEKFCYTRQLGHGNLEIYHMKDEDMDATAQILAESSNKGNRLPDSSIPIVAVLVKQYMVKRRFLIPHVATLVGFYKEKDGVEAELACTAEISLDAVGTDPDPGTPRPPEQYPYIGNVAVKKTLRRKGIGSELLKACEELIIQMKAKRKIYLHCKASNTGPLRLYEKAGYKIFKKDSILVFLCCKPRMYLLLKELPPIADENQSVTSVCNYCPI